MKCVECQHCTSDGVEPKMRRRGVNLCQAMPQPIGTYLTLEYDRQCPQYEPAPEATVAGRRAWLAERI